MKLDPPLHVLADVRQVRAPAGSSTQTTDRVSATREPSRVFKRQSYD